MQIYSLIFLFFCLSLPLTADTLCVDLSGIWEGTCEVTLPNGQTQLRPRKLVLKQTGCERMERNGEEFELDGSKTKTSSTGKENLTTIIHSSWSADRTQIVTNFSQVGRIYLSGKKFIHNFQSNSVDKLENGALVHQEEGLQKDLYYLYGNVESFSVKENCIFNKKDDL